MYYFIRFFVRLALQIYCYRIRVNDEKKLLWKGPLILASNHPNAYLDAIVIASAMDQPVYFLAQGEVTDRFLSRSLMKTMHIIPVYRMGDQEGNQERNERCLAFCVDILLKGGILLVFAEGFCKNNWQLRPIKKLTARIFSSALNHSELKSSLQILPVGLNYNSYKGPGKTVFIQFGESPLNYGPVADRSETEKIQLLSELLKEKLSAVMLHSEYQPGIIQMLLSNTPDISSDQLKKMQEKLGRSADEPAISKMEKPGYIISKNHPLNQTVFWMLILVTPAVLGWILHALLYYLVHLFVKKKTLGTVYYDSLLFTGLFLVYPPYWAAVNGIGYFFRSPAWIRFLLIGMPLLAWTSMYWQVSWQRIRNYVLAVKKNEDLFSEYFK
jgi:1-acyl-sn-glycerol-3-phosphate acyltransferase